MWRCFFGNYSAGVKGSRTKAKMRFLRSSVSSIPSFRWARWPFQATYQKALDSIQRHMIGILMGWRPAPHEPFEQFRRRRHNISSRLAARHGKWGSAWAKDVSTWGDHVCRNHDSAAWSHALLTFHSEDWLVQQRLASSGLGESRTNTRAFHGKVQRRWHEGFKKACT